MTAEEKLHAKLTSFPNMKEIAPWWKILLAKLFGERYEEYNDYYHMTWYYWRGNYYLTNIEALP